MTTNKGLEAIQEYKRVICPNCQYYYGGKCNSEDECFSTIIEKELKDYQEIREIAKQYNWDDITSEIFNVKTDKKYRDLFNSAIVNIQDDYRKARAFEIIKKCFYVAKSSGAILLTDYGFEHEEELKEVLNYGD